MTLYNCTAFNNGSYNYNIPLALATGKTATINNCVAFTGTMSFGSFVVQTTDSWSRVCRYQCGFCQFGIDEANGLRKADGSLPDINFMHLAAGSDLIDGGTYVGLPYHGSAPDLGYFEYGGCTTRPLLTSMATARWISSTMLYWLMRGEATRRRLI